MRMNNYSYIDGEYKDYANSYLHISDLLIQRGYAVFDFLLVKNRIPQFLSNHLNRLTQSVSLLSLDSKYTHEDLTIIIRKIILKNNLANSFVKIIITGGSSIDDYSISKSSLLVLNKPFELRFSEKHINGSSLISYNHQREIPEAKTINYIQSISLSKQMIQAKATDVLYLENNELVRECARCNIFCVKKDCIYTPQSKILKGITRKRVLDLDSFQFVEQDFNIKELLEADEVFISSTTNGIVPIINIDSKPISNGLVGPITKKIQGYIMK